MNGQLQSLSAIELFAFAGNATFTLVSKKTGTRFTYKFSKPETPTNPRMICFVSLFGGQDNESDYRYMGIVTMVPFGSQQLVKQFRRTERSKIGATAPSMVALTWFLKHLIARDEKLLQLVEVWHEGRCGKCGRKLTVPSSIESGFGPDCAERL